MTTKAERSARDAALCAAFLEARKAHPGVSAHLLITSLADSHAMSYHRVRGILIAGGVYTTKKTFTL